VESLTASTVAALRALDVDQRDAAFVADVLVTTDAWGVHTHGVKNLFGYLRRLRAGGIVASARPRLERRGGAWGVVDGQSGLGHVAAGDAMRHAIGMAEQHGIGIVTVRDSGHFGAAGYYAWMAAREGLVGLCMSNDVPTVAAPRSRSAVLGSNPIAYALPAKRHRPVLFDISTAAVAGGKVYQAIARGESIPSTWLLDRTGKPTTDPSEFLEGGALQPAAGHKGYGFALLIEALSGALSGASMTTRIGNWMWGDASASTDHGAAFIAIDAASISGGGFSEGVSDLIDEMTTAEPTDPEAPVLVPGQLEWAAYDDAMAEGLVLPVDVLERLELVTDLAGVGFDFRTESSEDRT
jgi:ureidoglycolate dehydrogenase (NAD+)